MNQDEITRQLAPLLIRPLRPAERRQLATCFEALARQQRELADADERSGVRVRAMLNRERSNALPRPKGGRPRGSGGRFVRIETPTHRSAVVHIAPALLQELGSPDRVTIARVDRQLVIRAAPPAAGYRVTFPTGPRGGMPRISIGRAQAADLGLSAGRHTAHLEGDAIVFM